MPTGDRGQWNNPLTIVAPDVELAQVLGIGAFIVRNFQNDLVLVRRRARSFSRALLMIVFSRRGTAGFKTRAEDGVWWRIAS
jgi:hypothetical protein